jgi:hypothetical protein
LVYIKSERAVSVPGIKRIANMIKCSEHANSGYRKNKSRSEVFEQMFTDYLNRHPRFTATWIPNSNDENIPDNYVDPGDIFVTTKDPYIENKSATTQLIDVKEARKWVTPLFPWDKVLVTKPENWRTDFIYIVLNTTMSHYLYIQPLLIPPDAFFTMNTLIPEYNRPQVSLGFPFDERWVTHHAIDKNFDITPYRNLLT